MTYLRNVTARASQRTRGNNSLACKLPTCATLTPRQLRATRPYNYSACIAAYQCILHLIRFHPKMTDKWTNKTTAKFIEVYKRHQCLWNIKHGLYKNKEARDVAYSNLIYEMARTLNVHMTVKAVREKIRSLRNTFINENKKIEEAKIMGSNYFPRLQWYESMMFLKQSEETSHVRCEATSMVSIRMIVFLHMRTSRQTS